MGRAGSGREGAQVLTDEPRQQQRAQDTGQGPEHPAAGAVGEHERFVWSQCASACCEGVVADVVEDHVVALRTPREVVLGVVDHVIGTERPHEVGISAAAHCGHFRSERGGNLHRERANPTGCPVDQDLLPCLELSAVTQRLQGGSSCQRHGGRLLEREVRRLERHPAVRRADVIGEACRFDLGIHLVTRAQPGHADADRFHLTGDVLPANNVPGRSQPKGQACNERAAGRVHPVGVIDGCRAHPDQHLTVRNLRPGNAFEVQCICVAIPVLHDRLHGHCGRSLCISHCRVPVVFRS